MKPHAHKRSTRNAESGYALLLIMFFLALLVLSTVAAAPTVLSSIQREREAVYFACLERPVRKPVIWINCLSNSAAPSGAFLRPVSTECSTAANALLTFVYSRPASMEGRWTIAVVLYPSDTGARP